MNRKEGLFQILARMGRGLLERGHHRERWLNTAFTVNLNISKYFLSPTYETRIESPPNQLLTQTNAMPKAGV